MSGDRETQKSLSPGGIGSENAVHVHRKTPFMHEN